MSYLKDRADSMMQLRQGDRNNQALPWIRIGELDLAHNDEVESETIASGY